MAGCLKTCDPCKCCVKNVYEDLTILSVRKGQWCETGPAFEDGEHALRFRVKAVDPDEKDKKKRTTTWSGLLFARTSPDIVDNAIIYVRDANIHTLTDMGIVLKDFGDADSTKKVTVDITMEGRGVMTWSALIADGILAACICCLTFICAPCGCCLCIAMGFMRKFRLNEMRVGMRAKRSKEPKPQLVFDIDYDFDDDY